MKGEPCVRSRASDSEPHVFVLVRTGCTYSRTISPAPTALPCSCSSLAEPLRLRRVLVALSGLVTRRELHHDSRNPQWHFLPLVTSAPSSHTLRTLLGDTSRAQRLLEQETVAATRKAMSPSPQSHPQFLIGSGTPLKSMPPIWTRTWVCRYKLIGVQTRAPVGSHTLCVSLGLILKHVTRQTEVNRNLSGKLRRSSRPRCPALCEPAEGCVWAAPDPLAE